MSDLRIKYIPQTSPDDPEEFGLEYDGPIGLGKRFRHMERAEVEWLIQSGEVALHECELANGRVQKRVTLPIYDGGGCV